MRRPSRGAGRRASPRNEPATVQLDVSRSLEGDGAVWADGIDLIYRKLLGAFEADGVKLIETQGQFFDPVLHEAISQEEAPDLESGQIIGVVQTGYTLGERVLRPARVRVAR